METTIIILCLFSIVQALDITEKSKLFNIWPKDNDWKNAKINKEKKQMFAQRFIKSEYYPQCEYEFKFEPIYYYPGDNIQLKCRLCSVGLVLNGQPKRWARVTNILDFFENYKKLRTKNGPTIEIIENYPFLGTQYDASILGKFYRKSKNSFLEVPKLVQTDGMLQIENAHPKSMGVYYCFDDMSIASQRFFYVLIPLLPVFQQLPKLQKLGVCNVLQRTGYPHFSWKDEFQPESFDDESTCFERYGKESTECIGKTQLLAIHGCENPASDCNIHFKIRNVPAKIHLKWSDWSPCDGQSQNRTGMCYIKLEKNLKPSTPLAVRDEWLMSLNKLSQFDGFYEGIPLNSGLIPLFIYKAKQFVGCIDEDNAKIDQNDDNYKKKSEHYSDTIRELIMRMSVNTTDSIHTGFKYCLSKAYGEYNTTIGTYTIDSRKCE